MCALRDSMHEYRHALKEVEKRLKVQKGDVEEELKLARNVFLEELVEQGRHQAWISSVVYSSVRSFFSPSMFTVTQLFLLVIYLLLSYIG